jgi:hypothetical protein
MAGLTCVHAPLQILHTSNISTCKWSERVCKQFCTIYVTMIGSKTMIVCIVAWFSLRKWIPNNRYLTETRGFLKTSSSHSIHSYKFGTRCSFKMFVHLASEQTKVILFVFSAALAVVLQPRTCVLIWGANRNESFSFQEALRTSLCLSRNSIIDRNVLILFCVDWNDTCSEFSDNSTSFCIFISI